MRMSNYTIYQFRDLIKATVKDCVMNSNTIASYDTIISGPLIVKVTLSGYVRDNFFKISRELNLNEYNNARFDIEHALIDYVTNLTRTFDMLYNKQIDATV